MDCLIIHSLLAEISPQGGAICTHAFLLPSFAFSLHLLTFTQFRSCLVFFRDLLLTIHSKYRTVLFVYSTL